MKLKILLVLAFVISAITARAQSSYTTIQYKNTMYPALMVELPNSTSDVEAAVLEKLKQVGYNHQTTGNLFWKKNKTEGFYLFNDVVLPTLGSQRKLDMYFKVVPKNNTEKENSTLYLLISTGNGYFLPLGEDSLIWDRGQAFLNGLVQNSADYALEKDIEDQETVLTGSRKKLTQLQDDEKQLADKIRKYQDDLTHNQGAQIGQQTDIDNQWKLLEGLKLKRKNTLSRF